MAWTIVINVALLILGMHILYRNELVHKYRRKVLDTRLGAYLKLPSYSHMMHPKYCFVLTLKGMEKAFPIELGIKEEKEYKAYLELLELEDEEWNNQQ